MDLSKVLTIDRKTNEIVQRKDMPDLSERMFLWFALSNKLKRTPTETEWFSYLSDKQKEAPTEN